MAKMTPMKVEIDVIVKSLKLMVDRVAVQKIIIRTARDKIGEIEDELVDLLESVDNGIEALDEGICELRNGIESLSEVV